MKTILAVSISIILVNVLMAQSPCPPNGTITNPQNPTPLNAGFKTNSFNWMSPLLSASNNSYYIANSPLSNFFNYSNPFYSSFILGQNSDFYPQDGWELIKRDFGILADGSLNPSKKPGPYMILYNKYTGKLRVVAAFPGLGAQQAINVTLSLISSTANTTKSASAVLNFNNNTAQPLDQPTKVTQVTSPAAYPGTDLHFFMADFQTAYDACTCKFESALRVDFSTVNTSDVKLYGRILGNTNPNNLYNSSSSTLQLDQSQSFLTSVYDIPGSKTKEVQAGLLTYKDNNSLISDYKASLPASDFDAIDVFGSILNLGIDLTEIISPEAKGLKGLKLAAKLSDFYSSKIKSKGDPTFTPPSVIHAELSATGEITDIRALGSSSIDIANPGSLNSNLKPEYNDGVAPRPVPQDVDYSVYNEVLGTFALLETPFFKYNKDSFQHYSEDDIFLHYDHDYYVKLSSEIKYVFNPVLNLDLTKTTVNAALLIETDGGVELTFDGPKPNLYNLERIADSPYYISNFLPVSDIGNLVIKVSDGPETITNYYLRFMINIVSNNLDKNGKQNKSLLVLTYEIPPSNVAVTNENLRLNTYLRSEKDLTLPLASWFDPEDPYSYPTGPNSISAWNSVSIVGIMPPITVSSPTITVRSGGVLKPNTILLAKPIAEKGNPVPPQSQAFVTDFCDNTKPTFKYKGNVFARTADLENLNEQSKVESKDNIIFVYPNPTSSKTTIEYSLREAGYAKLSILNISGQLMATPIDQLLEAGANQFEFDTSILPVGVYILKFETPQLTKTEKLVVIR